MMRAQGVGHTKQWNNSNPEVSGSLMVNFCYLTNGAQMLFRFSFRFRFQMILRIILASIVPGLSTFWIWQLAIGWNSLISSEQEERRGTFLNQAPVSALCFFISIFIFDFRFWLYTPDQNLKQKAKLEQPKQAQPRTEIMATTAAANTPSTRQPDDRAENTRIPCRWCQSMQLPWPQSNPWPMGPSLIELSAAVYSKIVCCSKCDAVWKSPILRPPQISRFRIPASLQRQSIVGYVALWEHSPIFSGLGAADTAAGRCISADAPTRPLAHLLLWF